MPGSRDVPVTIRQLTTGEEMYAAVDLYRRGLQLKPEDPAVPPRLLVALRDNGGSVIGAFDGGGGLVGLVYGFPGWDGRAPYHYSQTAVVDPAWQGGGIGRLLKLAQRDHVLSTGVPVMRWVYDPLLSRNAHFNLDVLGARGIRFYPHYYGSDIGPSAGSSSDRMLIEWNLRDTRPAAAPTVPLTPLDWGAVARDGDDLLLGLPADWPALYAKEPGRANSVRAKVAGALAEQLAAGYELTSCLRVGADGAVYRLSAAEDHA